MLTQPESAMLLLDELSVPLRGWGLSVMAARLGPDHDPELLVSSPDSPRLSTSVQVAGGVFVAFRGIVLGGAADPSAAAARLAHLLGRVRS